MSDFSIEVVRIDDVSKHPDADRLDLVTIGGYVAIANKHEDGSSRYKAGDLVVYIPEGAVLPERLMKEMDFWDVNKNKPAFRYVKAKRLRGIFSQGILYPVVEENLNDGWDGTYVYKPDMAEALAVEEGDNVADYLGIIKYEPTVPTRMAGQLSGEYISYTMKYDFESIQKQWTMFEEGEWVSVTEKLHGTNMQIGYIPDLSDPLLFGDLGNIYVTSKGVGARGFILKKLDANDGNIYVETLRKLLAEGLEDRLQEYVRIHKAFRKQYYPELTTLHLFAEIFGAGVQDLAYGQKESTVQFFDIAFNKEYIDPTAFKNSAVSLNLPTVPVLYEGPFNRQLLEGLRDGMDTISGTNIREGIVIKGKGRHPKYGRKVAKWVSPAYLLRKGNTTEFQ